MSKSFRIADAIWIATAAMHRAQPDRTSFTTAEVAGEVRRILPDLKPQTLAAHLHSHLIANAKPDGGRYRMLIRVDENTRRLYRPGDPVAAGRGGKTKPKRNEIPSEYHDLLDWYERSYCSGAGQDNEDPVEAMWGLGREIWSDTTADEYVASLRAGWREE